ncbi:hypothetical protein [Streptomyces sp. col6]|uniref:hypothetical protein n=1 Tax=Streptomyces sp. col6 TaxID=2478958 RepID=UPI001CD13BC2|nr:hypothetical protein [Streptomyces sp. col6]
MTDRVLELLRSRPELTELAAFPFDFDVERAYHVEAVHLASGAELEPIAGDATGGTYFLCGGTAVLYASSEGDAVLIADSVTEALEMLVRLPGWCEGLSAGLDEEGLRAAVRAGDAEAREEFAPELDAQRAALIEGLGLPERPLTELFARSESAARRTEPDHLLLNSAELCAYRLSEEYRVCLRDVVLGPGRAALGRLRSGDVGAREETDADPVLRAGVLRAAWEDRRDDDLPLLRRLLEREDAERGESYEERLVAAALVAAHGRDEDVALLRAATSGRVTDAVSAVEWAREREAKGPDAFTWVELARRQGRSAHARVELVRMLDDTGPQADRLRALSRALERLGEHAQAARAQFNLLSLQDTSRDRAVEAYVLARVERARGDLVAAGRALERARAAVGIGGGDGGDRGRGVPDDTVAQWHRRGLGRHITEQHLELVLAAVESGDAALARATIEHARALLDRIGKESAKALAPLSGRAAWAVAAHNV